MELDEGELGAAEKAESGVRICVMHECGIGGDEVPFDRELRSCMPDACHAKLLACPENIVSGSVP